MCQWDMHGRRTSPWSAAPHQDEPMPLIMPTSNGSNPGATQVNGQINGDGDTPFEMWKRTNVVQQKQAGYVARSSSCSWGLDRRADAACRRLADRYSNGNIRTTINQNMIIRWVPESRLADLYADLASQGLADPGAELVEDIIACPGTDTCGLGITSSKGLARALAEVFPAGRVPDDSRCECEDQRLSQLLRATPYCDHRPAWCREAYRGPYGAVL